MKGGGTRPHRIAVPDDARRALEHNSLLIYTSEAHVSGNIHQDIKDSYALEDSPTVAAMIRLREEAGKMAAALEAGDLDGYVDSLNASCRNLYRLHPSCDSEAHRRYFDDLDDVILGGKTCGAGGGGVMLVFTKPGRRRRMPTPRRAHGRARLAGHHRLRRRPNLDRPRRNRARGRAVSAVGRRLIEHEY